MVFYTRAGHTQFKSSWSLQKVSQDTLKRVIQSCFVLFPKLPLAHHSSMLALKHGIPSHYLCDRTQERVLYTLYYGRNTLGVCHAMPSMLPNTFHFLSARKEYLKCINKKS